MSLPLGGALFILASAALFVIVFHGATSAQRFQYDEADYMTAARMGFVENYIETSSMSFVTFVKTGLQAISENTTRSDLSEYIRGQADVSFYRHFHGPLYFDWLILVGQFSQRESVQRFAGITFHLLTFLTLWIGILWLFGPKASVAALIASSLSMFSITDIKSSLWLSAHPMYSWLAVLTLFVISRLTMRVDSRHLLGAVLCATVALCSLEYAVILFIVLGACVFLIRHQLFYARTRGEVGALLLQSVGVFAGVSAVLWPAGLFKLSMFKPYLSLSYQLFRRTHAFSDTGFRELWSARLRDSPIEFGILIVCLGAGLYVLLDREFRWRFQLFPFVVYALFILLISMPSDRPRFLSSALPALYVVGAVVLAERLKTLRGMARMSIPILIFAAVFLDANRAVPSSDSIPVEVSENDMVGFIAKNREHLHTLLVPAIELPTIHYYVPGLALKSYQPTEADPRRLLNRLTAGEVDALFLYAPEDSRIRFDAEGHPQIKRLTPWSQNAQGQPFVVYLLKGAVGTQSRGALLIAPRAPEGQKLANERPQAPPVVVSRL